MNERIKELILKAGWKNAYTNPKEGFEVVFVDEDHNLDCIEKFAELIIKKCVMIGNYAHDGGEYPGPMIKEYFGVE